MHVRVELDARGGLPGLSVIGLRGGDARDARERVQTAVLNSGFAFPRRRLTANLAPATTTRSGAGLDLALACCVLALQQQVDPLRLAKIGLFAELGLGGDLRPCPGVAAAAEAAAAAGLAGLVVALADRDEARAAADTAVVGLPNLADVASLLARRAAAGGGERPGAARQGRRLAGS